MLSGLVELFAARRQLLKTLAKAVAALLLIAGLTACASAAAGKQRSPTHFPDLVLIVALRPRRLALIERAVSIENLPSAGRRVAVWDPAGRSAGAMTLAQVVP